MLSCWPGIASFVLGCWVALPCAGSTEPLIVNVDHRQTYSLDGSWQTIVDPFDNGYYDYRYQPRRDGFFLDYRPVDEGELVEYDFDRSDTLQVPGDWNTQRERLFFYEGTVWYRKKFEIRLLPGRRAFLYFGAVNYEARVYLNGELVGVHRGGFTPFNFEVTSRIREGENSLVVQVDNRRRREAVPTVNTDWWNYGGITRRVMLVETPETFVRDFSAQLRPGSRDGLSGRIQLDGPRKHQQVVIRIPEASLEWTVAMDSEGRAEFEYRANVDLWSPEHPRIYRVELEAETDSVYDRIGFRTVSTRGTEILLNQEPIFLRGISVHEESPIRGGRAYSEEDARTLLQWARDLGCNFVRLAHYPHNEAMVRMADELGLLVWSEIPVYWTIQWGNPETLAEALDQLEAMIVRDRSRASVAIWSVGNETPRGEARLAFLRRLIERARELDPSRLISAATEIAWDQGTIRVDDPLGHYLDVLGANEYVGWYGGVPADAEGLQWTSHFEKPLVISEFGGGALYGLHGPATQRWTEEYQDSLYRHQIAMLQKIPFLRGVSPWILADFRSPRRLLPGIQDYWNRKGLVSEKGERKQAFYTLRDFYRELATRADRGEHSIE